MASRTADEVGPITSLMRTIFKNILMHICITLGVFGNILTLVVLLQKKMRKTSTAQYLAALTLFDLIFIICSFINNVEYIYPQYTKDSVLNPFLNLIFYPLADFSSNTSAYLILMFTIERYIAVAYPLHSLYWCRASKARKIIMLTILFTFLLTFPTFLENKIVYSWDAALNTTRPQLVDSQFYPNFKMYKLIYFWLIAVIVQFIPLTLLIILNFILLKYITTSMRNKNTTMGVKNNTANNATISQENETTTGASINLIKVTPRGGVNFEVAQKNAKLDEASKLKKRKQTNTDSQNKATILLIATVLVFLVCQLPMALLLIYETIFPIRDKTNKTAIDIVLGLNNIANGLTAINASVNFILYSCFSEKFRQTFSSLFFRTKKSPPIIITNNKYQPIKVNKNGLS